MGLETPNAGPIPYDVFIGRGWVEPFIYEGEDFSDVMAIGLGLTRKGKASVQYDLTLADGDISLLYLPPEGQEAVGTEPPNTILVRATPSKTGTWLAGLYAFDIAITRGDGTIQTKPEGLVSIREPA